MRKFFIVLVAVLCLASSSFAESWRVFDNAGLFSDEEIQTIEQAIYDFQRKTNDDFAVLTTDDYIGKENWQAIADSFYDCENFGFGRQASGMLYYIDMNQRIPYISTAGEMIAVFDADTLTAVHESAFSFLTTAQYANAVLEIIKSTEEAVTEYKKHMD